MGLKKGAQLQSWNRHHGNPGWNICPHGLHNGECKKGYTGRNINILSDGQAAIKALESFQINSKLVWDCHQSLVKLAEHNWIQLVWVPGCMEIYGNAIPDEIAIKAWKLPDKFQISMGRHSILGEIGISSWTNGNWCKWNSWWLSQAKLLTSTNRTWACTLYICKGCLDETMWLWRHLCQQDTALCSSCLTAKWMS